MGGNLYRTLWRWHFCAGLLVVPFILMLSLSGAIFLFKPQLDSWEERAWRDLPQQVEVAPSRQRAAALSAYPGAIVHSYRLPERAGDAAMIHLMLADGAMTDVFVGPNGKMLGELAPDTRISAVVQHLHGQLLAGRAGAWLVEAAGSWAFVLVVTGLFLWWPRGRGLAGVPWPRLGAGMRVAWRDLHAVTGFWVSGLALVLLVTALPWTGVWGAAFKAVREQAGWVKGPQDWPTGGKPAAGTDGGKDQHAAHDPRAMAGMDHAMPGMDRGPAPDDRVFDTVVARARSEHLAFPVLVVPPGPRSPDWVVRSEAQNRPLRQTLRYAAGTGQPLMREAFADKHPIDRAVGYGVAWHEGQLLGWPNQLVGLVTALMMGTLAVTGFVQWRRHMPADGRGVPPAPSGKSRVVIAVLVIAGLFLPMLGISLMTMIAGKFLLRRISQITARCTDR